MSSPFDWEKARRRDGVRRNGSEPLNADSAGDPSLHTAKSGGRVCHDCKKPIKTGERFAYRNPGYFCQTCAIKAFRNGRR